MQRFVGLVPVFVLLIGCGDDGGGDDDSTTSGPGGSTSTAGTTTGSETSGTTTAGSASGSTTDDPSTTSSGSDTSGSSSGGGSSSAGSTGSGAISFAEIQVELEEQGCLTGALCHTNSNRNVVLVADPDPTELMQNWQNIHDAPGVPWVTPLDDTAQMLNEVPIPDDVRARWLQWILDGAPF